MTSVPLRRLVPASILAAAIAAMMMNAPAASAVSTIESQCKGMGGSYYSEWTSAGVRREMCCYKSLNPAVKGNTCDVYFNGDYAGSVDYNAPPPGPQNSTRPLPPGAVAPNPSANPDTGSGGDAPGTSTGGNTPGTSTGGNTPKPGINNSNTVKPGTNNPNTSANGGLQ